MNRIFLTLAFLLFILLLTPASSWAHSGPPFIKVNDKANQPNPSGSGSVFFKVPNEVASENFIVNEKITFTVDTTLLPVDPSLVKTSDFIWEFGDSKTSTGLIVSNTYSKSGSYIVILKVKDPNYADPIELESMQINILPNKNSKPPIAKIKVDGDTVDDPFKEAFYVNKSAEIEFDAGTSEGDIKNYKWDFGDGTKLTEGKKVKHKFDFSQPYAYSFFPILRVEDKNGLFNDTIVQIANEDSNPTSNTATASANPKKSLLLPTAFISCAIIFLLGGIYLVFKNRSSNK